MVKSTKQVPAEAAVLVLRRELEGLRRVAAAAVFLCAASFHQDSPTVGHCRFCFQHGSLLDAEGAGVIQHLPSCPVGLVLTALEDYPQADRPAEAGGVEGTGE